MPIVDVPRPLLYTISMPASASLSTFHLSTARTWRGGENQIVLLCKGLRARGQQALILAPKGAPLLERAAEAGIPARVLTLRGTAGPAGTWRLARLLRTLRPGLLHLHDSHAVLPGQIAARAVPAKSLAVVAHRRTAFPLRGAWKYGGRVDTVIAISAAVRERVLAAGLAPGRVVRIFSGLEFAAPLPRGGAEARALRAELGIPEGAILVAHAAALTHEKRQIDLLAALAQSGLKATRLAGVHLALAGIGEEEGALRAQAVRRGVAGRVHLLGFRRDLRALWAAADLVAFASEAEGLCTALIEAQGAGLPAVVTRAGGMVEVVEEGVTGLTVPVGDHAALATALGALAADGSARARMGRAASARARGLFSAQTMVEESLALYEKLLRGR